MGAQCFHEPRFNIRATSGPGRLHVDQLTRCAGKSRTIVR